VVGLEEDDVKAWTRVAESWTPGMFDGLRKSNPVIVNSDQTPNAIANLTRWMGMYYTIADPEKQVRYTNMDYNDVVKDERRKLAGLAKNYETVTSNDVLRRLTRARTEEFNAYKDMHNIYKGMQQAGMSDNEIMSLLKKEKVSKQ